MRLRLQTWHGGTPALQPMQAQEAEVMRSFMRDRKIRVSSLGVFPLASFQGTQAGHVKNVLATLMDYNTEQSENT